MSCWLINREQQNYQVYRSNWQKMKKTMKYLRFQNLKLELQQKHPKEVSRAVLCFKDDANNIYKTAKYGEVTPQTIQWDDAVEIPFTNQDQFKIQTICQHQFGYAIDELQAMYNGQVYIKTENFFRPLNVHVFNSEGGKCGVMKYLIKVIEKQVARTAKKVEVVEEQPSVKVDLIGKINLYAAAVTISSASFKKDKYVNDLILIVTICGQKIEATYKKNYEWSFTNSKVEYMENSPDEVIFQLKQNNQIILAGETSMKTLMENKRFVTHSITLYNINQNKTGTLKIDLRFITKQQLLDLMYSPTKLSKNKEDSKDKIGQTKEQNQFTSQRTNLESSRLSKARANSSLLQTNKNHELKAAIANTLLQPEVHRGANRYKKVHVTNSYNQIIFSKAKRFSQPKGVNPYVSYSDPAKFSDFSPDNKNGFSHLKGPDISLSRKYDFTRQYKNNPGVGQYKLPSIWDKY